MITWFKQLFWIVKHFDVAERALEMQLEYQQRQINMLNDRLANVHTALFDQQVLIEQLQKS